MGGEILRKDLSTEIILSRKLQGNRAHMHKQILRTAISGVERARSAKLEGERCQKTSFREFWESGPSYRRSSAAEVYKPGKAPEAVRSLTLSFQGTGRNSIVIYEKTLLRDKRCQRHETAHDAHRRFRT